ncbi:MAG TPA: MXAN_5808 family serine peptidase, partial [Candidatus Nanopelagicales bacterium]|nr:MXAN_5808 family serine peptidase [Candidatus Nanopelagicales bacterium]
MTREVIKVRSVEALPLDGGVGYIRLKQFQATSFGELEAALDDFRSRGPIRGIVLDLRGNPGGLLDQAARIADKFLSDGVIVSTVGASEGREEKRAKGPGTEPPYPVVVLVSGNSASASEIVAGALKNHDRAVIVGQTTFGKGSVQLVFPDVTAEKAALKLTIAQYMTPGDVSIQGVGVTPDIELDPMTVDELEMDLTVQKDGLRERDLSAHLSNARAATGGKPLEVVRYQLTRAEREQLRERGGDIDDDFALDFPIRFARDLAARMPAKTPRLEQLRSAHEYIEQAGREELGKIAAELGKLGVDWAAPPEGTAPVKPELEVAIETDRKGAEAAAGQPMEVRVTVKNNGKQPIFRLRGTTESDNPYFDGKELIFGKVAPGQSKTVKAPLGWCEVEGRKFGTIKPRSGDEKRNCRIPMDALSRSDGLKVKLEAEGASGELSGVEIRPTVRALERPLFQYSYQIADDRGGNGDGLIQKGERVSMYLTVKNVGKGRSYETQANISNLSGDGLLLHAGRFDISNMQPGDVRRVVFTFDVQPQLVEKEATLTLSVGDRDLREFASEKVKIVIEPPAALTAASGAVKAGQAGAALMDAPEGTAHAHAFGRLPAGTAVKVLGRVGSSLKVDLGKNRSAFVAEKDVSQGGSPAGQVAFEEVYSHAPPTVEVAASEM